MRGSQDQQKCTWYDARLLKHQQYSETIISQHFVVCIGALLFVLIFKNGVIGHGGTNAFSSGYSLKTNHQWDTSTRQIHQLIPCCNTYIYIYIMYLIYYIIYTVPQPETRSGLESYGIRGYIMFLLNHLLKYTAQDFSCCHIALLSNRAAFLSG